jgi:hypothetical protein
MHQLSRSILSVLLICAAFLTISIPVVGVASYFLLLHTIPFLSTRYRMEAAMTASIGNPAEV